MITGISFEIRHLVVNSDFIIRTSSLRWPAARFPDRAQSPRAKCIARPSYFARLATGRVRVAAATGLFGVRKRPRVAFGKLAPHLKAM
jgi:hypothetical protein